MSEMTDYDVKVLRCIAGENVPGLTWGAAMSESLSFLRGTGLARLAPGGRAELTDAGRQFMDALE